MAEYSGYVADAYDRITGYLVVNVTNRDEANNRVTVSVRLYVVCGSATNSWSDGELWSWSVGGQYKSGSWAYDFRSYKSKDITTDAYYITLNDDGTDKPISCSASVAVAGFGTISISGSLNLGHFDRGIVWIHDGSQWRRGQVYIHNGTSWVKAKGVYIHNGTSWVKGKA